MGGAGWGVGGQHNHNLEALFVHCPGLKVVMPSSPADFKGRMAAATADNNPVLLFMAWRWPMCPARCPAAPTACRWAVPPCCAAAAMFDALKAPVQRLGGPDAPAAASWVLEQAGVPQPDAIVNAARRALRQTVVV